MLNQRVVISGSIAIDSIMSFPGKFSEHILPDQLNNLNVGFLVPSLKREFGGTAANIAYNLQGLGGEPVMLATIGTDGSEYMARFARHKMSTQGVKSIGNSFTAQAFITTDSTNNQLTAFHPGAMNNAHECTVASVLPAAWGTVSPNGKQAMLDHAKQFHANGVPYLLDPGQGLPMFDGAELKQLLANAAALAVNDYEAKMFAQKLGLPEAPNDNALAALVPVLIVTRGENGASVYINGREEKIAVAPVSAIVDPTGCGDAFRAGLMYGLSQGWDWVKAAKLGCVMGAVKIESHGPQNHAVHRDAVSQRLQAAYGFSL